jgi:hypothetical protein
VNRPYQEGYAGEDACDTIMKQPSEPLREPEGWHPALAREYNSRSSKAGLTREAMIGTGIDLVVSSPARGGGI